MLSAEEIWCQGFSEPNAGSDLAALSTTVCWTAIILSSTDKSVDQLRVGRGLVRADLCAPTPAVPKHKGLTALLVDMHSPGVEVRGLKQMSGESEFARYFSAMCACRSGTSSGKVNEGWGVAMGTLMHERGTFGAAPASELPGAISTGW